MGDARTAPESTGPLEPGRAAPVWRPGETIGRYVVLRRIGAGGCGEVLSAFDPVLDRTVALKLIRGGAQSVGALLREARILAKVSHPNIVAIHDAGVAGEHSYLAMELVDGSDLGAWLDEHPDPPWSAVLTLVREAARGLAAAHEQGVVHGDVKPANILVGGGRARVTDFGVAVWNAERLGADANEFGQGKDERHDADGAGDPPRLVGTPTYMAPEQHRGVTPDARSDQHAFCQTAWRALLGAAAYSGSTTVEYTDGGGSASSRGSRTGQAGLSTAALASLAEAKERGAPTIPTGRRVPRPILEALRRGMQPSPEARWPDMRALEAALAYDTGRRRRAALGGVTALALAGVASVGTAALVAEPEPCQGAAEALGVLAGPRLAAVDAALSGPAPAYATATRRYVSTQLRAHASEWQAMHQEACEATAVRREQSQVVLDRRMQCLARARDQLDAATWVLIDGGVASLPKADRVIAGLSPLARCADLEALATEGTAPADTTTAAAVDHAHGELARARALARTGRYDDAMTRLDAVTEGARTLEHPPWLAEVLAVRGSLLEALARYDDAAADLREALSLSLQHGPSRVAVRTAAELSYVHSVDLPELGRAETYGELALSLVMRAHAQTGLHASVLTNSSAVAYAKGEMDRVAALDREALAIREAVFGPKHTTVAVALENVAGNTMLAGDFAEAEALATRAVSIWTDAVGPDHPNTAQTRLALANIVHFVGGREREALAIFEEVRAAQVAALGERHPEVARTLEGMGEVHRDLGDFERADAVLQKALTIRTETLGAEHPTVARTLTTLGANHMQAGRPEQAEPMLRRALAMRQEVLGPDHVELAATTLNLGSSLLLQGKLAEAKPHFERALALWRDQYGADHPQTAKALLSLSRLELDAGRPEAALPWAQQGLAVAEAATDAQTPEQRRELVAPLLLLGQIQRALGDEAAAYPLLVRAGEVAAEADLAPLQRGDLALELSRARWVAGERAQARADAAEAVQAYRAAGARGAADLTTAETWLREHPA